METKQFGNTDMIITDIVFQAWKVDLTDQYPEEL